MKNFLKLFLFICIALLAVFSFGVIEPVSATELVINHPDLSTALAAIPLMTVVKNECTIPADVITEMKAKYGKLKTITVIVEPPVYVPDKRANLSDAYEITDKGEVYYFLVKRPDQGTVRMLMDYVRKGDLEGYVKAFINNLVVGGDIEALNDGIVYLGFSNQIDAFLKPYQSFLAPA